ncbi:MAG: Peptidase M16 domain protein [Candidatus Roizmanbacteria bacterium GW2011_GWA2_37_7]|uniref:Peptidase M16 domain protein n=1 Tax=Candidatus Roizmanbacteria bacterium GW2011_GWA2_37_7 TaxID=1618481 RepID=A0A0G0HGN0_9BACT|nr:MAG: Peptidase M16 domain protein [Candidatus Roizmanbacteria bacterium GW2011_GWA2_37_7]
MISKSIQLKNGLSILLVDTDSFPTMTMMVLIGAGSRYENKKNNGIAHFFEHMAFKGSKKYPSAYDISSAIEGMGAEFNAFTSKDHTGYWVKAPNEHFEKVTDVLSDMILHSALLPKEIEREKQVIVEEINMYEDTPSHKVSDLFDDLIFAGHPLGYDIAGTVESVRSFTKQTLTDYLGQLYHPSNAAIVIAGGLNIRANDRASIVNYQTIISERFEKWNGRKIKKLNRFISHQNSPKIFVKTKKTEQAHICIGYRSFAFTDPNRYALSVLSTVLGGGMSSRLFTEVRERRGLCYYVSTGRDLYKDTGYIVTQAGVSTDVKKLNEAVKVIIAQHQSITKGKITDKEITRAQALLKGRLLLSLEDSHSVASFYGIRKLLYGDIVDPQDIIASIDAVTKEDVVSVAKDLFVEKGLNIAAIGPLSEQDIHLKN